MSYTQVWNFTLNAVDPNLIVRDDDGAFIPADPDNMDYQEFLAWLDEGNEPTPYEPTDQVTPHG